MTVKTAFSIGINQNQYRGLASPRPWSVVNVRAKDEELILRVKKSNLL
jgi:hypothetical protein